jgi:hypothetical protein
MPILRIYPGSYEVITTGHTAPENAFSEADGVYSTATPGAKSTEISGYFDFLETTLPNGTINSIQIGCEYFVSTTASVATQHLAVFNQGSLYAETSDTSEPLSLTTITTNVPSAFFATIRAVIESGSLRARVRSARGNSSTSVTFNIDSVWLDFDYTPPPGEFFTEVVSLVETFNAELITRWDPTLNSIKNAPLTFSEIDNNLTQLNTRKPERKYFDLNSPIVDQSGGDFYALMNTENSYYNFAPLTSNLYIQPETLSYPDGSRILIHIRDDGTPRQINWSAAFRGIGGILPSITVPNKDMYFFVVYNALIPSWDVLLTTDDVGNAPVAPTLSINPVSGSTLNSTNYLVQYNTSMTPSGNHPIFFTGGTPPFTLTEATYVSGATDYVLTFNDSSIPKNLNITKSTPVNIPVYSVITTTHFLTFTDSLSNSISVTYTFRITVTDDPGGGMES